MVKQKTWMEELKKALPQDTVYQNTSLSYIYSCAPSGQRIGEVDTVVIPSTVEQVQKVVELAKTHQVPIVPVGGCLSLSDLTVPVHGGIVMDLRKMDRILSVDPYTRTAVIEAGVTVGQMIGYLKHNYPELRFSIPDAPPSATVCGNMILFGSGHLSRYGAHSDMMLGVEVVTCDAALLSIRMGDDGEDEKGPDWSGLFRYWFGRTGIVTKLRIKLYPRRPYRSFLIFKVENSSSLDRIIAKVTSCGLIEDVLLFSMTQKESHLPLTLLQIFLNAEDEEDFNCKKEVFIDLFSDWNERGNGVWLVAPDILPQRFLNNELMEPKYGIEDSVDAKKGGGCIYLGGNMPLDSVPEFFRSGLDISRKYGFSGPLYTIRNVGIGHSVIVNVMYPFNRADPKSRELSYQAMAEAVQVIEELGGIEWKPDIYAQRRQLAAMDNRTRDMILGVTEVMDPDEIFNKGNWCWKEGDNGKTE